LSSAGLLQIYAGIDKVQSQAQRIRLQCFWRHQFTQSLGKSYSPTAKDLGQFTFLIYLGICSVLCRCVCLIELGICKVNFIQQALPSLVLKGKVENKMHREFPATVQRQKAQVCWPVADLDTAFQPTITYPALRSQLELDTDLRALVHGEKDANSLLGRVPTDRTSRSRAHAEQHLCSPSLHGEDSGPTVQWLHVRPLFTNESGLSKLVGVEKRAVFFLYQWRLHEVSLSTLTTLYYHTFSLTKKDSVVSKNREMLLFGPLLTRFFCALQGVK